MSEVAKFEKSANYPPTATILDNDNEVLEVVSRQDGSFELTVFNRRGGTDRWDDMSVVLKKEHFEALGSIASHNQE
jgi:Ser/Thr protein kinase RdoA (MazF antagonist)